MPIWLTAYFNILLQWHILCWGDLVTAYNWFLCLVDLLEGWPIMEYRCGLLCGFSLPPRLLYYAAVQWLRSSYWSARRHTRCLSMCGFWSCRTVRHTYGWWCRWRHYSTCHFFVAQVIWIAAWCWSFELNIKMFSVIFSTNVLAISGYSSYGQTET